MRYSTTRLTLALLAFALLPVLPVPPVASLAAARYEQVQQHHPMGFDESKVVHHFRLYIDGGAIDLSAKDPADRATIDAVRAHAFEIATMFHEGRFETPMAVHHTTQIPGAAELTRLKAKIKYHASQTPTGARVDITTTDTEALKAVHAFLKYQITEHKTGDSPDVKKRT
jgi:hypothetical protein